MNQFVHSAAANRQTYLKLEVLQRWPTNLPEAGSAAAPCRRTYLKLEVLQRQADERARMRRIERVLEGALLVSQFSPKSAPDTRHLFLLVIWRLIASCSG